MLIRTPRPMERESLAGFLLRLAEQNGYHSPLLFLGHYNWKPSGVYYLTAEALGRRTGISVDFLEGVVAQHAKSSGSRYTRFGPSLMLTSHLELSAVPVCSDCIEQGLPHLALFHIIWVTACPHHGKELITLCPACKRPLDSRRPALNRCRCGESVIRKLPPKTLDPNYLALLRVLDSAFYEGYSSIVDDDLIHLRGISAPSLCVLFEALANLVLEPDQPDIYQSPFGGGVTSAAKAVPWLLTNWPRNLHSYLDARYGRYFSALDPLEVFSAVIGRWIQLFRKKAPDKAIEFQFFTSALIDFSSRFADLRRLHMAIDDPDLNSNWILLSTFSAEKGIEEGDALAFLKERKIHTTRSRTKRRDLMFLISDLGADNTEQQCDFNVRSRLKLQPRTIAALRDAEVLSSTGRTPRSTRNFFTEQDISRCLTLLHHALNSLNSGSAVADHLNLSQACKGSHLTRIISQVEFIKEQAKKDLREHISLVNTSARDQREAGQPKISWRTLVGSQ